MSDSCPLFLPWGALQGNEKAGKVQKLAKGEVLMLNIGSMSTGARVLAVKADMAKLQQLARRAGMLDVGRGELCF